MADNKTAKSGAKLVQGLKHENGLFISAWKFADGVLWNIKIFQNKDQKKEAPTKSKKGKLWHNVTMVCTAPLRPVAIVGGLLNEDNNKVYFNNWNWMCNPSASNGGYIGKHISKQ